MILVIGNTGDISADYFMEWCRYLNTDVLRLNEAELLNPVHSLTLNEHGVDIRFRAKGFTFLLSDVKGVWFRRGYLQHKSRLTTVAENGNDDGVARYLNNESESLNDFIIYSLLQKKHLNDPKQYNANKLIALHKAMKVGLLVPSTLLTRKREDIFRHFGNDKQLITKSIQDAYTITISGYRFAAAVQQLPLMSELPGHFFYSAIQQCIDKKYELRIFFIEEIFYSGAIFPQSEQGKKEEPRIVPFLLPDEIKIKLMDFNRSMHINCGSIDMIVDKQDRFWFLEINPVGQYDYLGKHCNYHLDKAIASFFAYNTYEAADRTTPI